MNSRSSGDVARLKERMGEHMIRYVRSFAPHLGMKAKGSYIYDETGRQILDFGSGQACAVLGHNHPSVTEAIEKSCEDVIHLFSGMLSPPVLQLAEELSEMLPPSLQKMMFMSTGSESNEAAIRMAKLRTGGFEIIGFTGSWHGMTLGSLSSTYNGGRIGYGPAAVGTMAIPGPNCYRCPIKHCRDKCDMTCLEVGFRLYDSQTVGAPAAVVAEVIQGSTGVVPPEGYFPKLKQLCHERGLLLILDEALTGLGRLGSTFAFEQIGIVPDFVTLSKTLGNGLPLAATITSNEIERDCFEKKFMFYTSHLSDPMPAAVGLAVLRVVRKEKLAARAQEMGQYAMNALLTLQQRYECIGEVRGRGLMIGVEIVRDRDGREGDRPLAEKVQRLCLDMGLILHLVRAEHESLMRLAPPLTVSEAELDKGIGILDKAFRTALS